MTLEQNKAIALHHYKETNHLEAAFERIAPEVAFHVAGGAPPTYEGWRQTHAMFLDAFPDLHLTIEDQVAEGEIVVTRWTIYGTHRGELMGLPPTSREIKTEGISIDRIAGGRVVEHWAQLDLLGMMQQLGAT